MTIKAALVGVVAVAAGCGSAWCPMCPPESDSSSGVAGSAGVAGQGSGGSSIEEPCPTTPLQEGRSCSEPDRVCTARLADGQILGCTCTTTQASRPTWDCDVVSCPDAPVSADEICSIYLLGERCEGAAALCECRWDSEAWEARWAC